MWGILFKLLFVFLVFALLFGTSAAATTALILVVIRTLILTYVERTMV